jgi:hypothetical protein
MAGVALAVPAEHLLHAQLADSVAAIGQDQWDSVVLVEALIAPVASDLDACNLLLH